MINDEKIGWSLFSFVILITLLMHVSGYIEHRDKHKLEMAKLSCTKGLDNDNR